MSVQTNSSPVAERSHPMQYLTFSLGGEVYGAPIDHIREIIEHVDPTTIPMMPSFLRGVINLRGAVVPIIDLNIRFGRSRTEAERRSCVVIAEVEHEGVQHPVGILVDGVNEVVVVERDRLESRPSFGTRLRSDFVEGVLNLESGFVIALDLRSVLSIDEMAAMVALAQGGHP